MIVGRAVPAALPSPTLDASATEGHRSGAQRSPLAARASTRRGAGATSLTEGFHRPEAELARQRARVESERTQELFDSMRFLWGRLECRARAVMRLRDSF